MSGDFMQKFEAPIVSLEGKLAEFGSTLKVDREKLFTEPEYFVTIVGEFSSGKSSILNRLFFGEKDTIPTAIIPETYLVNEIRHGDLLSAVLVSGGVEKDIDVADISEVSKKESATSKNCMIKMTCPDDFLADKVVFVDTPGVNSINESHTNITFGYLPKSQFILFVVDINHGGLTRSEIDFIKNKVFTVTQNNIFILINKSDSVIAEECEKIREQVVKDLANTGIKPERVCLVSGLKGTGIAELKATLKRELDVKRAEYYKNYTQNLVANFADLAVVELKLKLENIKKDAATFATDKAAMEQELKFVLARYGELKTMLNTKIEDLFRQYDSKIAKDLAKIAQKICIEVKKMPLNDVSGKKIVENIQTVLKNYVENDLSPVFLTDMRELLNEIKIDAEGVFCINSELKSDFIIPGKVFSGVLFVLGTVIVVLLLPNPTSWPFMILVALIGDLAKDYLKGVAEKPVKSIICNNIMKTFNEKMIPAFIDNFNAKSNEVALLITNGIEDAVNAQRSMIENSYNEENIKKLKAQNNIKGDIEAAIKDAETLKALVANYRSLSEIK